MSLTFSIVLYLFIFNSFLHISSPYLYLLHFGEIKFSACSLVVSALDRCRLLVIKRMIGFRTCTHQIGTYVFFKRSQVWSSWKQSVHNSMSAANVVVFSDHKFSNWRTATSLYTTESLRTSVWTASDIWIINNSSAYNNFANIVGQ